MKGRKMTSTAVLIPVYNEEAVLAETVYALVLAGYSPKDIYIVNDKSTDNTALIGAKLEALGVHFATVPQNGGKAAAQRYALAHFNLIRKYHYIAFLDGDTKVQPDFKKHIDDAIDANPRVALFVGQVSSAKNNHLYSANRAYHYTYAHDVIKKGQDRFQVVYVSPGCASIYKSDVLHKLHIDSDTLAEDMDLTIQVHRLGYKVKYVHDAIVVTQDPNSFKDYYKQVMRWSRGFWQIVKKYDTLGVSKKQRVDLYMIYIALESLFFNRVFVLIGALFFMSPTAILLGLLFDFMFFAGIGVYASIKTKRLDICSKMFIFYWLSYVNLYAHLTSFIEIIVLRKNILAWNKVKRYQFNQGAKT